MAQLSESGMMYLDESLPIGALSDLESELLWDRCCRESPEDPWKAFEDASDANVPPTLSACSTGQGKALSGDFGDVEDATIP